MEAKRCTAVALRPPECVHHLTFSISCGNVRGFWSFVRAFDCLRTEDFWNAKVSALLTLAFEVHFDLLRLPFPAVQVIDGPLPWMHDRSVSKGLCFSGVEFEIVFGI